MVNDIRLHILNIITNINYGLSANQDKHHPKMLIITAVEGFLRYLWIKSISIRMR